MIAHAASLPLAALQPCISFTVQFSDTAGNAGRGSCVGAAGLGYQRFLPAGGVWARSAEPDV